MQRPSKRAPPGPSLLATRPSAAGRSTPDSVDVACAYLVRRRYTRWKLDFVHMASLATLTVALTLATKSRGTWRCLVVTRGPRVMRGAGEPPPRAGDDVPALRLRGACANNLSTPGRVES